MPWRFRTRTARRTKRSERPNAQKNRERKCAKVACHLSGKITKKKRTKREKPHVLDNTNRLKTKTPLFAASAFNSTFRRQLRTGGGMGEKKKAVYLVLHPTAHQERLGVRLWRHKYPPPSPASPGCLRWSYPVSRNPPISDKEGSLQLSCFPALFLFRPHVRNSTHAATLSRLAAAWIAVLTVKENTDDALPEENVGRKKLGTLSNLKDSPQFARLLVFWVSGREGFYPLWNTSAFLFAHFLLYRFRVKRQVDCWPIMI